MNAGEKIIGFIALSVVIVALRVPAVDDVDVDEIRAKIRAMGGIIVDLQGKLQVRLQGRRMSQEQKNGLTDGFLASLARLPALEQLDVRDTAIADRRLISIGSLVALEELNLTNTPITDEGLKQLKGLKELRTLHLIGTQATAEGLKHLADLPRLKTLYVTPGTMTDEDAKNAGLVNVNVVAASIPGRLLGFR